MRYPVSSNRIWPVIGAFERRRRWLAVAGAIVCLVCLAPQSLSAAPAEGKGPPPEPEARVTGLKYNCVHVLKLEKTLELYRGVLGFKLVDSEVLHGDGIEGMLIMKLRAGDFTICLSLTAPEHLDSVGPIGNTNHNHFMLLVNDIVPICDRLKEKGYELENEGYARDKYTFFTGPNGEIIGLTEHR